MHYHELIMPIELKPLSKMEKFRLPSNEEIEAEAFRKKKIENWKTICRNLKGRAHTIIAVTKEVSR